MLNPAGPGDIISGWSGGENKNNRVAPNLRIPHWTIWLGVTGILLDGVSSWGSDEWEYMYSQIQVQDMYIWECGDDKQMQGKMQIIWMYGG